MAGRGRGRGRGKPQAEKDGPGFLNMSLDELIKGRGPSLIPPSAVDEIDAAPAHAEYNVDVNGTLGARNIQGQVREYKEDVFKSLDEVVNERGLLKPPKYTSHNDDDLPITGKNSSLGRNGISCPPRKLQMDSDVSSSIQSVIKTTGLDPRGHSLDELINRAKSESRGRGRGRTSGNTIRTSMIDPMSSSLDEYVKTSKRETCNSGSEVRKMKSPTLDPMANSLDAIIEDRDIGKRGESNGPGDRKKRFRDDGEREEEGGHRGGGRYKRLSLTPKVVLTPYRAVGFLQNKGMMVNLKLGKKTAETKEDEDPLRKWRCVVSCGNVRGVCDCLRKTVAREIACDSFMKNLKEIYPGGKIPHYEIPKELFLDPQVIHKIEKLATEEQTNLSFEFSTDLENAEDETTESKRVVVCVYYVGDKEFTGRNPNRQYAQLIAAGKVHESLAGEPYPKTVYFANEECDLSVEYDFFESENHLMAELVEKNETDVEGSMSLCSTMLMDARI